MQNWLNSISINFCTYVWFIMTFKYLHFAVKKKGLALKLLIILSTYHILSSIWLWALIKIFEIAESSTFLYFKKVIYTMLYYFALHNSSLKPQQNTWISCLILQTKQFHMASCSLVIDKNIYKLTFQIILRWIIDFSINRRP